MSIEVEICDRCGECFSWHGETDGIRKIKIKERGYECSPDRSFVLMADNLFEERQAMLVWLFVNVCLVVCTAVAMGWK